MPLVAHGLGDWLDEFMAEYARAVEDPLNHGPRPHVFQELMHSSPAKLTLLVAGNRLGKAQPVDEPVLTPTGWRPIGELAVGDEVIAGDGSVTTVAGVFPQGVRPVFRVTFDDGSWTRCCEEHLWRAKDPEARFRKPPRGKKLPKEGYGRRYGQWGVYSLREIRQRSGDAPRPRRRFAVPRAPSPAFPSGELPLDPYLLGVILGDGGITTSNLTINSNDPEVIAEVAAVLPPGGEMVPIASSRYGWGVRYGNKRDPRNGRMVSAHPVINALRELGLMGLGSGSKFVPEQYLLAPEEARLALLQGLMDTDGHITQSGNAEFCSTSRSLAEAVLFLARTLGHKARLAYKEKTGGRPAWRVYIRPGTSPLFRLPRKLERQKEAPHFTRDRILTTIEPDGEEECVCIAVTHPERTYVTRDLIVTHNSYSGMREVLWRATMTHPYRDPKPIEMIWCGFPSYPFFRETTRPHFLALCPKDRLIQFHETEFWARIRREDGGVCTIFFKPYEQGRDKWQGAAVDFMWLDEEVPEDIYREGLARLIDKSGDMLLTFTPVSGMGWLYDRLYLPGVSEWTKPVEERTINVIQAGLASRDPEREFEVGEPLVPHLTRDQIVRFASGIPDPDERSIRIFGEFKARSGLVYKEFRPAIHVVPAFEIPHHWEIWAGVDPGYHGFAVVFFAQGPDGRIYVVDEYFSQQEPTGVRAAAIWEKASALMGEKGPRRSGHLSLYVDTEDPQLVRELNLWSSEHGYPLGFASLDQGRKARLAGITRIQELLVPSPDRDTPALVSRPRPKEGEPRLYFFDNLMSQWKDREDMIEESRVIWEMSRYLWKRPPRNRPAARIRDDADESSAGGAHALASLRYGVMARIGSPEDVKDDPTRQAGEDAWVWRKLREEEEERRWLIGE